MTLESKRTRGTGATVAVLAAGAVLCIRASAKEAAPKLANFYDGFDFASQSGHPDLTAIGHSYGSLATGLALQQPGHHGVDNMVVYGSPGIEAASGAQLGLQPGHGYVMRTDNDPIGPIAETGRFGPDPATNPNFHHLSTHEVTTPDGIHRSGSTGHSEYPRLGDNHQLRTAGYNLAVITAGLSELAVPQ